jgi:hypothetical protein
MKSFATFQKPAASPVVNSGKPDMTNNSPPPANFTGLEVSIGGSAVAVGSNTLATGIINETLTVKGFAAVVWGNASFTGMAQGSGSAAGASTFASFKGVDIVIEWASGSASSSPTKAAATASLTFVAIDFAAVPTPTTPTIITLPAFGVLSQGNELINSFIKGMGIPTKPLIESIMGNLATVSASATAVGPDTHVATLTHSLAVNGTLSLVDGLATVAIA